MSKIEKIYDAVDDFGLITSLEASRLGMSNAELVQQAAKGKLVRVARGVYRMPVWPAQPEAPYATAVKAVGEDAFLYGESVVALLNLAPTNPTFTLVASPKRIRRNLGNGAKVIQITGVTPVMIEGIHCQPIASAIAAAATTMGSLRALDAAREARTRGLISCDELSWIEREVFA